MVQIMEPTGPGSRKTRESERETEIKKNKEKILPSAKSQPLKQNSSKIQAKLKQNPSKTQAK